MNGKILVTYATRTGSTVGVADAIGKTLVESGFSVDVLPMKDVPDLTPYRAVVAGSAIQGGQWLPEAVEFIRSHRSVLAQKPFAAFLVCMTLAMKSGSNYRSQVAAWMAPVRSMVKPASEGLFTGAFELNRVPSFADRLKFRLAMASGVWPTGDHRDWDEINTWAESLRPLLVG